MSSRSSLLLLMSLTVINVTTSVISLTIYVVDGEIKKTMQMYESVYINKETVNKFY